MKTCPQCSSLYIIKAGFVQGVQRYKCKKCCYYFTVRHQGMPAGMKRLAIHLWLEGLSIRNVGRILNVSDVAVGKWIKPVKTELGKYRAKKAATREIHSVEHFMITKNMFRQYGWLIIGMEENDGLCLLGSTETRNIILKSE